MKSLLKEKQEFSLPQDPFQGRQKKGVVLGKKKGSSLLVADLGLETLEGSDGNVRDVGVQLLLGLLIIVTLAGQANADAVLDGLNTLGPDLLVQAGVDTDIGGTHGLLGKGLDGLDGVRSTLLEGSRKV